MKKRYLITVLAIIILAAIVYAGNVVMKEVIDSIKRQECLKSYIKG